MRKQLLIVVAALTYAGSLSFSPTLSAEEKKIDFVKDVQPILAVSCVKCHGADPKGKKPKGKYDLTTKAGAMESGDHKKDNIVPKQSEKSLFYTTLLHSVGSGDDEIGRMPYKKDPLTAEQIALLKAWIDQGAAWPDGAKVALKE